MNVKFYHGSDALFNSFQVNESRFHLLGNGVYFYKDIEAAKHNGNHVYEIRIPKTLNIARLDFR